MKVLDREVFDRGGPSHVRAFLHVVLFTSIRLLVVHPQQTRSRTLTVAVTHPGTNAHTCSLTSSSDNTTIYPQGHWYLSTNYTVGICAWTESLFPPSSPAEHEEESSLPTNRERHIYWIFPMHWALYLPTLCALLITQ